MILFGCSVHPGLLNVGRILCVQPHWTITEYNYRKKRIALLKDNTDGVIGKKQAKSGLDKFHRQIIAKNLNLTKKSPRLEMGQHAKTAGIVWLCPNVSTHVCVRTCLVFQSGRWFCLWRPTDTCCGRLPVSISIHSIDWPHQKQTQHAEIIAPLAAELKKDHHAVCPLWH